jgi:hypothetical protein
MKAHFYLFLLVAGFLALAPPLHASRVVPIPIEQLAQKSQLVLHATVRSKTCLRDEQGRIYTRVELQVSEVWKGALATNRFIMVHGGGILGQQRLAVSGQAEFKAGEELVAFLIINRRGEGVSVGMAQGKFRVWSDPKTGQKLARNSGPESGPAPGGPQIQRVPAAAAEAELTLEQLKQRVRRTVQ